MFKKWLAQTPQKKKVQWLILIGCVGMLMMLFSSFLKKEEEDSLSSSLGESPAVENSASVKGQASAIELQEKRMEKELEDVLSKIAGVNDVSVIVNLDSTEEEVVGYDVRESSQITNESDTKGGTRSIEQKNSERKTALYRGDGGERPLVIKRLKPKVRGVLVVARGVENVRIKALVMEAVQRALDVPMHRISVLPKG